MSFSAATPKLVLSLSLERKIWRINGAEAEGRELPRGRDMKQGGKEKAGQT